jgi:uncharacterized protein (TIGR02246 family)
MLTMGENDVWALYGNLIAAWNDHDGDAMAEPFAADGVVIGFDGSVSSGTQTISTDLSSIFADHETGRYAVKVHSVRPLGTQVMILRAIAGLVPPGRTAINPETNSHRQSSPKSSTASGRLCCSKTLPLNSTAALAWSRT